ncbi:fimbrial biogenesis outer membrane usher protein [Serratia marcescens]|uniref:fimbria/pilus outer membrane usher protein n=1 Tax=Serratia marcescens TaxID=615 RepID=UPI0022385316|nr:fimbria/pilus outer membrane usher protein [Serratia marcescens]MCW6016414.1 fimbrial biogenesis outer membrane usher protein [Serratia marcescens]MCW6025661.1 fimbrial biogenesis outer membrane usher protein [Serratia marcescens]
MLFVVFILVSVKGRTKEYHFDTDMLGSAYSGVDLSALNKGGQLPGLYFVNVLLNGNLVDSRKINFRATKGKAVQEGLTPCLPVAWLASYGIKTDAYFSAHQDDATADCADMTAIAQSTVDFDFNAQTLSLTVPPDALSSVPSDIAPVSQWDEGIPALLMNYLVTGQHIDMKGQGDRQRQDAVFLQMLPGMNVGGWRVRNMSSWQKNGDSGQWQNAYTYASHGIDVIKSRLTIGDSSTPSDVFDSLPFRGVMLGTDENMIARSQRAFSPVIRGIARTRAEVDIRQNGYTLYHTVVPAGPFTISDMPSTPSEGNIDVTVIENDGERHSYSVPYVTPPIALHAGYFKYGLVSGWYRPASPGSAFALQQATAMYGLPGDLTLLGGTQLATGYGAAALGIGALLGHYGAVSFDVTGQQDTRISGERREGDVWRIRYRWSAAQGVSFWLTQRHLSAGYTAITDMPTRWECRGYSLRPASSLRAESQAGLSWSLGSRGSLHFDITRQSYHAGTGSNTNMGIGYDVVLPGSNVFMGLNFSRQRYERAGASVSHENTVTLTLSVPLNVFESEMYASYQMTDAQTRNQQIGLQGTTSGHQLHWGIHADPRVANGYAGTQQTGSLDLNYKGTYGELAGNASDSRNLRQYNATLSGGMLLHDHGLTLGQTMDETVALFALPGASGVPVGNFPGEKTDYRGYAIVNGVNPYQENTLSIDPLTLPADVSVEQTDARVVPTSGAVVPVRLRMHKGTKVFFRLKHGDGQDIPFGALVSLMTDKGNTGIVGARGLVYMSGVPDKGQLNAVWRDGGKCSSAFKLTANANKVQKFRHVTLVCD